MEAGTFYNYEHAPTHLFVPEATYMLTAGTYKKQKLLNSHDKKMRVIKSVENVSEKYNWLIIAWVILDNHYHTILKAPDNIYFSISDFARSLHKQIAWNINRIDNKRGRHVMKNYWDKCITYEKSYWARLNYINNNPVKHGYVESAANYPFGSYYYSQKEDWATFEKQYPWNTVNEKDDF